MPSLNQEVIIKANATNDFMGYSGIKGVVTRKLPISNDPYDYEVMFSNGTYDYFSNDELEYIQ